jgi:hypothetical protein
VGAVLAGLGLPAGETGVNDTDLTEAMKARLPMPHNTVALWKACLIEAARHVTIVHVHQRHGRQDTIDRDLRACRSAWAVLALSVAISPKHVSSFLGKSRHYAAEMRCRWFERFGGAPETFGGTLIPEWGKRERSAA